MKRLNKTALLEKIEQEHERLLRVLSTMDTDAILAPGVITSPGSVQNTKDILAHLSAWEERMQTLIRAMVGNKALPQYPGTVEFNRQVYEAHKNRPLDDIWASFEQSYTAVCSMVQQLSEADLGKDQIWQLIRFNTYNHYAWARRQIQLWRKTNG